ncbi:galactose-6-phosphate isomerase subunit LacA [Allofustis seminis]|uniref:galactose-6-phosphate isomerase subunit LacA n=1 Tax=Allofustis seminis TaxID=166939 RepID=UPI000368A987|nr:galactose-6-phosphate isomerase subunit LacA [Allofustis seminis]
MSTVYISADEAGMVLKQELFSYLKDLGHDVTDLAEQPAEDFVASTEQLVQSLNEDLKALGILIDAYGAGSFMAGTKHHGIVVAELSDERTGYMTREHNNARVIAIGSEIVGRELAKQIAREFLEADYDGGRHQVRVDMLNALC